MNKKRGLMIALGALLCVVALVLVFCLMRLSNGGVQEEKLKVTVLKVGKADAIVMQSDDGHAIMLDTGEIDDEAMVLDFLKNANITKLDALIISHFDKDHIGTAGLVMENLTIDRVLIPDYESSIVEYADFMGAMKAALIEPERVSQPVELTLGESTVLVEPPMDYDVNVISDAVADYDNTLSLFTTVTCGEKKLLFTGDADKRRINEWLKADEPGHMDFLKVPHHGQYNTAMESLLQATTPTYAAITCSKKNPADEMTLSMLQKYGVDVYQTRNGQITLVTDGQTMNIRLN